MNLKKYITVLISAAALFTGCAVNQPTAELNGEGSEVYAVKSWFENDMTDEDEFTNLADYQYYARTVGLDKDGLLNPNMWEIYYSYLFHIKKCTKNRAKICIYDFCDDFLSTLLCEISIRKH